VRKPDNLNFLEPSGPLQACDGTAFPAVTCNLKAPREVFNGRVIMHYIMHYIGLRVLVI
jgi:hypothetical protein